MSSSLAHAGATRAGYDIRSQGTERAPAAHEVLAEHPSLVGSECFDAIASALDMRSVSERKLGRRAAPRTLNAEEYWQNISSAAAEVDSLGIAALAGAELDPGWVVEKLQNGEVDEVAVVAGFIRRARELSGRVFEAHMRDIAIILIKAAFDPLGRGQG